MSQQSPRSATSPAAPAGPPARPAALVPPARSIDPRGQRFGAGVSAAVLVAAFGLGLPWLAVLVGLDLTVSAALGTRYFLPGRPWPFVRRALRLGPAEPEHEYPPRFAQALGATFIGVGALFFAAAFAAAFASGAGLAAGLTSGPSSGIESGLAAVGWVFVLAVAALQTLLAATGVCVGCRLYFLRWWVPSAFARLIRRADSSVVPESVLPLRRLDA